jgi:hypothetical protein
MLENGSDGDAGSDHARLRGMQAEKLRDEADEEAESGASDDQEILPLRPEADRS